MDLSPSHVVDINLNSDTYCLWSWCSFHQSRHTNPTKWSEKNRNCTKRFWEHWSEGGDSKALKWNLPRHFLVPRVGVRFSLTPCAETRKYAPHWAKPKVVSKLYVVKLTKTRYLDLHSGTWMTAGSDRGHEPATGRCATRNIPPSAGTARRGALCEHLAIIEVPQMYVSQTDTIARGEDAARCRARRSEIRPVVFVKEGEKVLEDNNEPKD